MLRQKPANVIQVGFHVLPHVAGRRHGFQLRPAAEADVRDGLGDLLEINLALAQQVRVVLQMEFADTVFAKPTDFLE